MPKRKSLAEALIQRNRISRYIENTRGRDAANRFIAAATKEGSVIGNISDALEMRGLDSFDYSAQNIPISYRERTSPVSKAAYDAAMKRINVRKKSVISG